MQGSSDNLVYLRLASFKKGALALKNSGARENHHVLRSDPDAPKIIYKKAFIMYKRFYTNDIALFCDVCTPFTCDEDTHTLGKLSTFPRRNLSHSFRF